MDASSAGNIVLVPFPFSDLSTTKLRPALVLADAGLGDRVCVQITSNPYADRRAVRIDTRDFRMGSLDRTSYARPGKLFTAHEQLFRRSVAQLSDSKHKQVVDGVGADEGLTVYDFGEKKTPASLVKDRHHIAMRAGRSGRCSGSRGWLPTKPVASDMLKQPAWMQYLAP